MKAQFEIILAADIYEPKEYEGLLSTVAISDPLGEINEQSSKLYPQEMAKRGFGGQ